MRKSWRIQEFGQGGTYFEIPGVVVELPSKYHSFHSSRIRALARMAHPVYASKENKSIC